MAIRGAKNPFPDKQKLKSGVFTTPQKMDPQPSGRSLEKKVRREAMKHTDRKNGQ